MCGIATSIKSYPMLVVGQIVMGFGSTTIETVQSKLYSFYFLVGGIMGFVWGASHLLLHPCSSIDPTWQRSGYRYWGSLQPHGEINSCSHHERNWFMDLVILGKISTSLCIPLSLAMLQLHDIGHNGEVMMSPPPSMPTPACGCMSLMKAHAARQRV